MKYKEGDIIASKIRFITSDEVCKRILLIVNVNKSKSTYECCCLTTHFRNLPWQVDVSPNDWNHLDQTSYVQLHEIYELDDSIIFKKYGDIDNPHIHAWNSEWQTIYREESQIKRMQRYLNKVKKILDIKTQPLEMMADLSKKKTKRKQIGM